MGRILAAVAVGYLASAALLFAFLSAAWYILGATGIFPPGSWRPLSTWIVTSILAGLAAAIVSGMLCARIARDPRGPRILAGVMLVIGLLVAIPAINAPIEVSPRPVDVSMLEAMEHVRQPGWVTIVNPLLGVAGVMIGAWIATRRNWMVTT